MDSAFSSPGDRPAASLFVSMSCHGGTLTVRPAGPALGQREAPIIDAEVKKEMERLGRGLRKLVLDLSNVQIMPSFGLGLCIELRNAANRVGAGTIVFGLTDELTELFRMMKVDRLYTIVKTNNELARSLAA